MQNTIIDLNFTNYDDFLKDKITLVDFWAEWCHPCKLQQKLLEEITQENQDVFRIAKLNVDDNKIISSRLGVRNIPTLILYKDGKELRRIIGLQSKEMILNQINNALSAKETA